MAGNLRKMAWKDRRTATIGIGTLIVFIALVLTAAIASAVILKTAYSLKDQAEAIGEATTKEVSGGIKVLDITGSRESFVGSGVRNTNIERVTFLVTVWSGSQGVNILKMKVHYMGPTRTAYLILDTTLANYLRGSNIAFGCDKIPALPTTGDWTPPTVMMLQWETMAYIEIEVGQAGLGERDALGTSGLAPNSFISVYFEPTAGLVVEESLTTPSTYGTNTFIDLTMQ